MNSLNFLRTRTLVFAYRLTLVVAILAWVFGLLSGCGPSRATRTALDEANRMAAECRTNAAAIAESAPSIEEGERLLELEQVRCAVAGCAYCTSHHLDCSSLGLECTESP